MPLTIVVPAYREEDSIGVALATIAEKVRTDYELLVVVDDGDDPTVAIAREFARSDRRVRVVRNRVGTGRGLLNAVRTGIAEARGRAVVITMADVTDDIGAVDTMVQLHRAGHAIVAPSRHMRGSIKTGGPLVKSALSRWGGVTLRLLTGLPTSDPTNAFKLFDADFLRATPIESTGGFEYSLELCAKAFVAGRKIVEFPTTWRERTAGRSKFKLWRWLPRYFAWYWWLVRRTWIGRRRR